MMRRNRKLSAKEKAKRLEIELSGSQRAMSPQARAMWERLAPEVNATLPSPVFDAIYQLDFRTKPVPLREFLSGKEYLGSFLRGKIFDCIVDDLEELFERNCAEALLTGAIGWGKTRMAELGIAYELYRVSCLRDPAEAYGLMPGSTLAFLNVSVTQSQAKRVLFGGLFDIIRRSEYFRKQFPFDANIQSEIRFPRNVTCYPVASTERSMLGEGIFSAAFDEINFMPVVEHSKQLPEGGTYDHAAVLYNRLSRRIRSRMNQRGRLPGHLWLISSARYPNDFTERKAAEARTDERIFVRSYPAWGTRPKHFFMPETFKVEVGDTSRNSRVLKGEETDVDVERVIEVPVDYKDEFEKDPDGAVRDYAGISVLAKRPFIVRRDLIARMFQLGEEQGLKHPFSKLDVTLQDESEFLRPENLHWIEEVKRNEGGRILFDRATRSPIKAPKLYPAMYFAHVDLAKTTDACGVGIGHVVGTKQVQRGVGAASKIETKPIIRMDLVLRIVAPPRGEILAANVRGLFYQLSKLGMEFGKITYDQFGSMESIQTLQGEGYNAESFSVDASTWAYEQLKTAIYDERMLCYRVPILEKELTNLELDEKRQKIDHPPRGSKDLADCLAAVVAHCEASCFTDAPIISFESKIAPSAAKILDREELWEKAVRGEVMTEEEIDRM